MLKVREVTRTWTTGEGHEAKTRTFPMTMGRIVGLAIPISSVTDNPTVAITFRDGDSCAIIPDALCAALADGTNHYFRTQSNKATQDADFDEAPVHGTITVSIDPSADPGGSSQTLTVKVRIFVET